MFGRLKYWQKGIAYSLIFALALSVFVSLILIFFEIRSESMEAPHFCFAFAHTECSFRDAILTRVGFIPVMFFVFGLPLAIFSFVVGLLIDKMIPPN